MSRGYFFLSLFSQRARSGARAERVEAPTSQHDSEMKKGGGPREFSKTQREEEEKVQLYLRNQKINVKTRKEEKTTKLNSPGHLDVYTRYMIIYDHICDMVHVLFT